MWMTVLVMHLTARHLSINISYLSSCIEQMSDHVRWLSSYVRPLPYLLGHLTTEKVSTRASLRVSQKSNYVTYLAYNIPDTFCLVRRRMMNLLVLPLQNSRQFRKPNATSNQCRKQTAVQSISFYINSQKLFSTHIKFEDIDGQSNRIHD